MNFDTTNPMLMLIDLQNAIDDPSWGVRNNPEAEDKIQTLLKNWRAKKLPILHIKHMSTEPESKYFPGTVGNDFKQVAMPLDSEDVIEKDTNSAFIRTNLDGYLQERSISEVVIVGVITNNSVEATARMSGNLGYKTFVVSDATYTFDMKDFAGQLHTAETVHNMSLANLQGEYAHILNTEEVLKRIVSGEDQCTKTS
ncbi:cysteine hydrolase family protein [Marinomonas sp. 2405UD66-6]|uniref:cysteine hydrolase family protein n=1 Tax=Marinomonas sp. 2405UD66-6 TaxID=3391834 RepID=UPI0039C98379